MNKAQGSPLPTASALMERARRLLSDARDDRDAAYRYPVMATADNEGGANARILILRDFDAESWRVTLHTDRRSAKMSEIAAGTAASLVFYDHAAALQVRMKGIAGIEKEKSALRKIWENLPEGTKPNYRSAKAPGAHLETTEGSPVPLGETDGFENFAVIRFTPESVDILQLSTQGNTRYRFSPRTMDGTWLVP